MAAVCLCNDWFFSIYNPTNFEKVVVVDSFFFFFFFLVKKAGVMNNCSVCESVLFKDLIDTLMSTTFIQKL